MRTCFDTICIDSACRQPIQIRNGDSGSGKQRVCEFCKCSVPESRIIQAFRCKPSVALLQDDEEIGWIEWELDDGGDRTIMSYGCDEVNMQRKRGRWGIREKGILCYIGITAGTWTWAKPFEANMMFRSRTFWVSQLRSLIACHTRNRLRCWTVSLEDLCCAQFQQR